MELAGNSICKERNLQGTEWPMPKKIGLTTPCRNDSTTRKCIRALTCLPLLPETDMANAIDDIGQQCAISMITNVYI